VPSLSWPGRGRVRSYFGCLFGPGHQSSVISHVHSLITTGCICFMLCLLCASLGSLIVVYTSHLLLYVYHFLHFVLTPNFASLFLPRRPLFKPCKCSGSIGLTHQDCLTSWLDVTRGDGKHFLAPISHDVDHPSPRGYAH
jgi:hypothetical protein